MVYVLQSVFSFAASQIEDRDGRAVFYFACTAQVCLSSRNNFFMEQSLHAGLFSEVFSHTLILGEDNLTC